MSIICKRHNQKEQTTLRKALRNNATTAEAMLWRRLKGSQTEGLKFRRQHGVGPYVLDFYCPELRLGIELDGEVHNSQMQDAHDHRRTAFLNEAGISILRYENAVVYRQSDIILDDITHIKEKRINEVSGHFSPAKKK